VRPAQSRCYWPRLSGAGVKLVIPSIGVGLQDALPTCQMLGWMFSGAISGEAEHDRRRRSPVEGAVIAHIGPEPRRLGAATGQERHRGVIPMQPGSSKDMRLDHGVQWLEQLSDRAHLVGERGEADVDRIFRRRSLPAGLGQPIPAGSDGRVQGAE